MNLRDISNKLPLRLKQIINHILNILVIVDVIAISSLIIFMVDPFITFIITVFDLFVCAILLTDFFIRLIIVEDKKQYFKENWLDFLASIPYDLILPTIFSSVRYLRLVKLIKVLRVAILIRRYFKGVGKFIEDTAFDKILSGILITIVLFTFLIYLVDPTMDIFESLWFVIVTITTIGYVDVTPQTFNAKVISLILIVLGVFIFPTIIGLFSSFFNKKVLKMDGDNIEDNIERILDKKIEPINNKLENISEENKKLREENQRLYKVISELKEIIKNKK